MPRKYTPKTRYKLLFGKHGLKKEDGSFWKNVYAGTAEDVVTSDIDLEKAFPNKFRRLTDEEEVVKPRRGRKRKDDSRPVDTAESEGESESSEQEESGE